MFWFYNIFIPFVQSTLDQVDRWEKPNFMYEIRVFFLLHFKTILESFRIKKNSSPKKPKSSILTYFSEIKLNLKVGSWKKTSLFWNGIFKGGEEVKAWKKEEEKNDKFNVHFL